jgi:hypothetical protein
MNNTAGFTRANRLCSQVMNTNPMAPATNIPFSVTWMVTILTSGAVGTAVGGITAILPNATTITAAAGVITPVAVNTEIANVMEFTCVSLSHNFFGVLVS